MNLVPLGGLLALASVEAILDGTEFDPTTGHPQFPPLFAHIAIAGLLFGRKQPVASAVL
jgi:hypothetical protein